MAYRVAKAVVLAIQEDKFRRLRSMNAQNLSTILRALAMIDGKNTEAPCSVLRKFFVHAERELISRGLSTGPALSLSNALWAYAEMRVPAPLLCADVVRAFKTDPKPKLRGFGELALCNLLWSLALLQAPAQGVFAAVAECMLAGSPDVAIAYNHATKGNDLAARLARMRPYALHCLLWAFGQSGCAFPELYTAAADALVRRGGYNGSITPLSSCSLLDISTIMATLVDQGVRPHPVFAAAERQLTLPQYNLSKRSADELCALLDVFVKVGDGAPLLLRALAGLESADPRLGKLKAALEDQGRLSRVGGEAWHGGGDSGGPPRQT
jgi:hypothetical protein